MLNNFEENNINHLMHIKFPHVEKFYMKIF